MSSVGRNIYGVNRPCEMSMGNCPWGKKSRHPQMQVYVLDYFAYYKCMYAKASTQLPAATFVYV